MKKSVRILIVFLFTVLLSACQASPKKEVVASRNDGSFDANAVRSAEESHASDETEAVSYFDTFLSTDGSVTFQMEVQSSISTPNMPAVEVIPHTISEKDAHNAALALCGSSAVFYEAEPTLNEMYSKSDVIAQIGRWSSFASTEGMKYLFPNGDKDVWESDAQTLREGMAYLTERYLNDNTFDYEHAPCQWIFKKSSYYVYGAEEAEGLDTSHENDEISAWVANGDGRYAVVTVSRRNADDYKLNNIYYNATISGPLMVEYAILRSEKLRTEKPTEDQIAAAVDKAQAIIDQMNLGTWKVVFSNLGTYQAGDSMEYLIHLTATPVFEGVSAILCPQLNNLKSQAVFASNYYLTEAVFDFSADGTLMDFTLYSPVDVKQVVNKNVKTMTVDQIIGRAKEQLSLSDAYAYGAALENMDGEYSCTVNISQVEYGLARTKAPNTDDSYYYVPAVAFRGNIEYCMQNAAVPFYYQDDVPLLMLNAIDGTVIPLSNE